VNTGLWILGSILFGLMVGILAGIVLVPNPVKRKKFVGRSVYASHEVVVDTPPKTSIRPPDAPPVSKPGDPPSAYSVLPGTSLHEMMDRHNRQVVADVAAAKETHPGRPCNSECWRKPDGHRWS
jgi:hypothetical protein